MNTKREGYLRAYAVLERLYAMSHIDELAILLGAMDIDLCDDQPMDPAMWKYWEEAYARKIGFDLLPEFLQIYAQKLSPPAPEFSKFIRELQDSSSTTRREALAAWEHESGAK